MCANKFKKLILHYLSNLHALRYGPLHSDSMCLEVVSIERNLAKRNLNYDSRLGMKKLWKNVKEMGLVSTSSDTVSPVFTADEFNRHCLGIKFNSENAADEAVTGLMWLPN